MGIRFFWRILLAGFLLLSPVALQAQVPVTVSHQTQVVDGKKYYIHIVQQGQTVYSISRAYGLKAVDAIVKKDIHFLSIGDTVWLPCRGQQFPSESAAASQSPVTSKTTPATTTAKTASPSASKTAGAAKQSAVQPIAEPANPRERISNREVVVSLFIPLYLDQLPSISTTKFDIEQRGKKSYRSFDFIQFYEGILIGIDKLNAAGFSVRLNVVDVPDNKLATVERLFADHNVVQSDIVIGMLTREPFNRLASLCRDNRLFLVNPMASRSEILKDNPYVFKCVPSHRGRIASVLHYVQNLSPKPHLLVIHSGAKEEQGVREELQVQLEQCQGLTCTYFDWKNNGKLATTLKQLGSCVVLSIYDHGKEQNRLFAGNLLNRLNSLNVKNLITLEDWTQLYNDVDFSQLQRLHYKTVYEGWDYYNISHQLFLGTFRDRYQTEPIGQFAAMGNDIIVYFVTGLSRRGKAFWSDPNISQPKSQINTFTFSQKNVGTGFENNAAKLFELRDYQFRSLD